MPIISTDFVGNFNPYTAKDILNGVMFEPLMVFNDMTDGGKPNVTINNHIR